MVKFAVKMASAVGKFFEDQFSSHVHLWNSLSKGKSGCKRFFLITLWEDYPVILCCDISVTGGSRYGILGNIADHMRF